MAIKRRTLESVIRKRKYKELIEIINIHLETLKNTGEVYPTHASEKTFLITKNLVKTLFKFTKVSSLKLHLPYKDYLELFTESDNEYVSMAINNESKIDYVIEMPDLSFREGVCYYDALNGNLPEELNEILNEQ
jgi:hypothetical protein